MAKSNMMKIPALTPYFVYCPLFNREVKFVRYEGIAYAAIVDMANQKPAHNAVYAFIKSFCDNDAMRRCQLAKGRGNVCKLIPEKELCKLLQKYIGSFTDELFLWYVGEGYRQVPAEDSPPLRHAPIEISERSSPDFEGDPAQESFAVMRDDAAATAEARLTDVLLEMIKQQGQAMAKQAREFDNKLKTYDRKLKAFETRCAQATTLPFDVAQRLNDVEDLGERMYRSNGELNRRIGALSNKADQLAAKVVTLSAKKQVSHCVSVALFAEQEGISMTYTPEKSDAIACSAWYMLFDMSPYKDETGKTNVYPTSFLRKHASQIYGKPTQA